MKLTKVKYIFITSITIILSACQFYRPDLQQGHYLDGILINELKLNQSQEQVQNILGSPGHISLFNKNCWNYYFTKVKGINRQKPYDYIQLSLFFTDNKLKGYQGNVKPKNLPEYQSKA